jgi:hypothetical protein
VCVRASSRISLARRRAERGVERWLPALGPVARLAVAAMRKSGDGSEHTAALGPIPGKAGPVATPHKRGRQGRIVVWAAAVARGLPVRKRTETGGLEFEPGGDADDGDCVREVVLCRVGVGVVAREGVGRDLRDGGGRPRAGRTAPRIIV